MAIDADTVVAGAPADRDDSIPEGAAYVFTQPPSGWANAVQTAKLTGPSGAGGDGFGSSVAIGGNVLVVGALGALTPNGGAAYIFDKPASGWAAASQRARLGSPDSSAGQFFGPVATDGGIVVAGASSGSLGSSLGRGAAFVFGEVAGLPTPTVTTLASSTNPSLLGQALHFTATIEASEGTETPTGTVQFAVDGTNVGDPVATVGGSATSPAIDSLGVEGQALGAMHTVTARYAGDPMLAASSGQLRQTVHAVELKALAPATVRVGEDLSVRFTLRNLRDTPRTDIDSGAFERVDDSPRYLRTPRSHRARRTPRPWTQLAPEGAGSGNLLSRRLFDVPQADVGQCPFKPCERGCESSQIDPDLGTRTGRSLSILVLEQVTVTMAEYSARIAPDAPCTRPRSGSVTAPRAVSRGRGHPP